MKHTFAALTAICSVAFLTYAPSAEATGGRSIRADLPCPFGGVNAGAWVPAAPGSLNPNPGLLVGNATTPIAASAFLVAGPNLPTDTDDNGFALADPSPGQPQASQFDWYVNPIPNVSNCSDPSFSGDMPVEQVMQYNLASGQYSLGGGGTLSVAAGDREVEFNYASSLAGVNGVASFAMGGVTYTSTGTLLPTGTFNDFLFDQNGKLLGALDQDSTFSPTFTTGLPTGWTSSGGTVSAPEIDASSAVAGLTLLLGGLTVLRGRRTLQISSVA
jgi:hypothetical protein